MARPATHNPISGSRRPAFTLLEVLVVAGVAAMLLGVMVPGLVRARESARRAVCVAHMKAVGVGLFTYAGANNDYAPPVMTPIGSDKDAPRVFLSRVGGSVNLGLLLENEVDSPEIFYCPSQEQFSYSTHRKYLGRANIAGSYVYRVNVPAGVSTPVGAIRHLALITDDFTARLGARLGNGHYTHRDGYNVAFTDGSVDWYTDKDEMIAKRAIQWDDETDEFDYSTFYQGSGPPPNPDQYGDKADIFRAWHAFCYSQPHPFD
jgi:prepilin-type processing-associated H-X9-DG protein